MKLPSDYSFGISAASAENPDSFEAYKFILTATPSIPRREHQAQSNPTQSALPTLEDTLASSFKSQDAQFEDIHNRLQVLAHAMDAVFVEITKLAEKSEWRHQELVRNALLTDKLNLMDQRIQNIESIVREHPGQFANLQRLLKDSHSRLTVGLPEHMSESKDHSSFSTEEPKPLLTRSTVISRRSPRMGIFLSILMVFQLLLAASYVVYKKRRANGPKKYL